MRLPDRSPPDFSSCASWSWAPRQGRWLPGYPWLALHCHSDGEATSSRCMENWVGRPTQTVRAGGTGTVRNLFSALLPVLLRHVRQAPERMEICAILMCAFSATSGPCALGGGAFGDLRLASACLRWKPKSTIRPRTWGSGPRGL